MNRPSPAEAERFILANTTLGAPPHVPEIRLHLADEAHELWEKGSFAGGGGILR